MINTTLKLSLLHSIYESSDVMSLLLLSDGRLASCTSEGIIVVYSKKDFAADIIKENAHDGKCINYLAELPSTNLVSCGEDCSIQIWKMNKDTLDNIKTITLHKNIVFKVIPLSLNRFASCSNDNSIIVFSDTEPYEKIAMINLYTNWVYSIIELKGKNLLASGSDDKDLRFWDLERYELKCCLKDIDCCDSHAMLEIPEKDILIVGGTNVITVVNTKTLQLEKSVDNNEFNVISSLILVNNALICLCGDQIEKGNAFVLDSKNYTTIKKKEGIHFSFVYCGILLESNVLATCGGDKKIKFWSL